jgi:hypothetical protein
MSLKKKFDNGIMTKNAFGKWYFFAFFPLFRRFDKNLAAF